MKLSSSSRYSTRSRAVIFPRSCWRLTARSEPAWYASSLRLARSSRRSRRGMSMAGEASWGSRRRRSRSRGLVAVGDRLGDHRQPPVVVGRRARPDEPLAVVVAVLDVVDVVDVVRVAVLLLGLDRS